MTKERSGAFNDIVEQFEGEVASTDQHLAGAVAAEDELEDWEPDDAANELIVGQTQDLDTSGGLIPVRSEAALVTDEGGYSLVPVHDGDELAEYDVPVSDRRRDRTNFLRTMRQIRASLSYLMMPVCRRWGINSQQFYILLEMEIEPGQTVGKLCDSVGLSRTTCSSLIKKLDELGYVTRKVSTGDSGFYALEISAHGIEALHAIEDQIMALFDMSLSAAQRETFERIIVGLDAMRELMAEMRFAQETEEATREEED